MIRDTVVWHQDALDQLASLWFDATDRPASTRASDAIDAALASDAHARGNPTGDRLRVLYVPPLKVLFEVSEPDRMARILVVTSLESPHLRN